MPGNSTTFDKGDLIAPLVIGVTFLLSVTLVEFLAVLFNNDGLFVYTLDDAYIHLALSENIINGHYGINADEYSAPSSSILWPFIVAPVAFSLYSPLLLNILFALAAVYFYFRVLRESFPIANKRLSNVIITYLLIMLMLATNIIGLVFTGMEHTLQIVLVALITYGLIIEAKQKELKFWLLIAITIAPLIRYESTAISVAALLFLALRGHRVKVAATSVVLVACLALFSLFLLSMGLDILPTSVAAKSAVVDNGAQVTSILENLRINLGNRQGQIITLCSIMLFVFAWVTKDSKKKHLATVTVVAIVLHMLVGKFGWYNRYEIYIWTFVVLNLMYLFGSGLSAFLASGHATTRLLLFAVTSFILVAFTARPYLSGLLTIPLASNNIYEQQYQMHRFITTLYDNPVAVNDIGYVSFDNENYVLDLAGLASIEAFKLRKESANLDWMQQLTDRKNIALVMVYEEWFPTPPARWVKVGDLHLGKRVITPAFDHVSFYATDVSGVAEISDTLRLFADTLPPGAEFRFSETNLPSAQ